uniref:Uncharacterized protein n=1 Tax=Arundo donax TaxID=35708 RepID=A0A0A9DIF5_ARUDO
MSTSISFGCDLGFVVEATATASLASTVPMRSMTTESSCCACCRLSMRPCHGHACWAVSASAAFLAFLASFSMTQEKSMRRIAASRCSSLVVSGG